MKTNPDVLAELAALRTTPIDPDWLLGPDSRPLVGPTVSVRIPKRFYEDHTERGCEPGHVVRETGRYYDLVLDRAAYDDLLSDADYYGDPGIASELDREYQGLVQSARATARKLQLVEVPW